MALWLTAFPQLSWEQYLETPAGVIHRAVSYLKTKADVDKAKQDVHHG